MESFREKFCRRYDLKVSALGRSQRLVMSPLASGPSLPSEPVLASKSYDIAKCNPTLTLLSSFYSNQDKTPKLIEYVRDQ